MSTEIFKTANVIYVIEHAFCNVLWLLIYPFGIHWVSIVLLLNTLRPRRNGQHFADDIFKHIFFNGNVWISINISLMLVPKDPINNIPALPQMMAWRCPGNKPLSDPMVVSLPTHICVTRPQWVLKVWMTGMRYKPSLNPLRFGQRRISEYPLWNAD